MNTPSFSATNTNSLTDERILSFDKRYGFFLYPRYTHNSTMKDYNDDGYFSADIGGWYRLSNKYKMFGYMVPTELIIQPTFGVDFLRTIRINEDTGQKERGDNRYKYQLTLIPKVGNNFSLLMTGTGYREQGEETEWDFSIGPFITFD